MKKTLFLSAILATALCSSAFGAVTTDSITISKEGEHVGTQTTPYDFNLPSGNAVQWEVTMEDNTWITNTGNAGSGHVQIHSLTLAENGTGTITVNEGKMLSFISSAYGKSYLTLNGGTLVKQGDGEMIFTHVEYADGQSSDTGTIDIQDGTFTINNNMATGSSDKGVNIPNYDVKVADGARMNVERNSTMKSLEASGTLHFGNNAVLSANTITLSGASEIVGNTNTNTLQAETITLDGYDSKDGILALKGVDGSLELNISGNVSTRQAVSHYNAALSIAEADTALTLNFSNGGSITTDRVNFSGGDKTSAITFNVALNDAQLNELVASAEHDLSYTLISAQADAWNRELLGDAQLQDVESLKALTMTNLGVLIFKDNKYYTMANSDDKASGLGTYCISANEVDVNQYVGSASSVGYYAIVLDDQAKTITFEAKAPEPTTATLSLLALAGLCARRRRY